MECHMNYHKIEISMVLHVVYGFLSLMHYLDLEFEAEMQYDLFLRINC